MKKITMSIALVSLLSLYSYSQDNKPEANSFGLQYGVNFNGTVGQAVQFSGWLKNGIEVRGSATISFSNSQSTTLNLNYIAYTGTADIPAVESYYNTSASISVSPSVSVVKHFTVKGNLDFFVGGAVNFGISAPTKYTSTSTTVTADSFYSYNNTSYKIPVSYSMGLSITGGANFFFYKNLAIGADFNAGISYNCANGNYVQTQTSINSGLNNPNQGSSTNIINESEKNSSFKASLTGNAGLHLTYYLKVKPKKQSGDQKM